MRNIVTIAVREFRSTALTRAFLFGAVIFPIAIWGIMIAVTSIKFERPVLEGTLVLIDKTKNSAISKALAQFYDPAFQEAKAKQEQAMLAELQKNADPGLARAVDLGAGLAGLGKPANVTIETLGADADPAVQRERARRQEVLAVVTIDERTLELNPQALVDWQKKRFEGSRKDDPSRRFEKKAGESDAEAKARNKSPEEASAATAPGSYEFVQGTKLRPDHADDLRAAIGDVVKDERYRRANVNPLMAKLLGQLPVEAKSIVMTETGERQSNQVLTRLLPFVFLMLIYIAAVTGGQYLMLGTLEEKGSRVMEVILSACSARELMIGKLIGQGLVGLAVLGMYAAVGSGIAGRFGVLTQIPTSILPWMIFYFLLAYFFIGALMLAVGSAVTEIREAQALYTPITIVIVMPFMLMIPIMQNPGSLLARIFSFFPPTTPYVMVMRMSQPSHVIPVWELIATAVCGLLGVAATVWMAAKIFRIGVLMYGKPPSLMELVKWVRLA